MSDYARKLIALADANAEIAALEDGYVYYFPSGGGALSASDLRTLADEIDRRNREWDCIVRSHLDDLPLPGQENS